ncbi:MAG: hypothetical protein ABI792_06245 [bacterium]
MENSQVTKKDMLKTKIERKKFFLYSGAFAFGIYTLLKAPFNFFPNKPALKESSIKITQNPHAIQRKPREVSNG